MACSMLKTWLMFEYVFTDLASDLELSEKNIIPTVTGLEPAIFGSEVRRLIH